MGNQKMKEAMSKIQDRDFDANELTDFEAMLWREKSRDALSGFDSMLEMDGKQWKDLLPLHSALDVESSGIDDDRKRYQDQAMDCWQTGFSNHQKKVENLKNGDFKQLVIPSDNQAGNFEASMQTKIAILTGLFFVRHQGGTEAMDDFFTFAKKYVEKQEPQFVYESEIGQSLFVKPQTLTSLLGADSDTVKETVQRLLAASEKISPQKLFSTKPQGFADDLQYLQLRRILMAMIEQQADAGSGSEVRELIVKLLLRWGLIRASAEDLLLAAQLQQKYNIDISSELEFVCKQSEVFKKPAIEVGGNPYERTDHEHIQSRVDHNNGSDRAQEWDQAVTDGSKWFIFSDQRGMSRGTKPPKTGHWQVDSVHTEDKNWSEMTMLCHDGNLLVRHAGAPDVPFQVFSKETLKPTEEEQPFGMAEGEDYLKWTPMDTDYEENQHEGNRWMRASPMFSDGELIYLLVQYRQKGFTSPIVKTVCEVYEVSDDRKLKRQKEVVLFKNDNGDYYKGSKKNIEKGGHLARGSIACNGDLLIFWTAHNFHVYDMSTGIRKKKEHVNSTSFITCYDAKEQWYYYMDAACYSWLKRCHIVGFKPRQFTKEAKDLPDLPIVFDTHKSDILAQIEAEKKKDEPENEEEKEKKKKEEESKKPRSDLFELLAKQDEQALDRFIGNEDQEEKKRTTEPIANISEISQAIILSKMSIDAQTISYKLKAQGDKKLLAEEMLPYFKAPYAIYGSKSYLILLRQALEDHYAKLSTGKITTLKQSNVLNLIYIYQANIDCLTACRTEMKHVLPESELKKIHALQNRELENTKLFEGQAQKKDEDLTPEEIFQMYLVEASTKLNQTLEANLDSETRLEKLTNIEQNLNLAMTNEEGPEAKVIKRVMPIMSSKKALNDIFAGDENELAISRRIIAKCIDYLVGKVSATVANSCKSKVFQHREVGINKDIRVFTKAFCQELMVAFGNQLLTIIEKQDCKKEGELSQEEEVELKQLRDAEERKKILEPMLYETYILISQRFKVLIEDITKQISQEKVYDWEDKDQIKGFYDFISVLFNAEKSIPRITLMYNLMMNAHKPELIWLDEISEALKNSAEGLNAYLVMNQNLPHSVQARISKLDSYSTLVKESLRAINYTIGVIAYRLILLNKDETEENKKLHHLNILQGGIEGRFIPSLSQDTKTQIEGSFKITNDKQLQQLALQSEDKVILEAQDTLLQGIIDNEKSQPKIEMTLDLLQQGLVTKQPMVPFARLGGEWGIKLSRAAFGVMLKFTDNFESFLRLTEAIDRNAKEIGEAEQGDQKIKSILNLLKDQANDDFFSNLKQWEQASNMRKWTQKVKLNLSERLKIEVEEKLREEITAANPSKEPFTDQFNEEQKNTIETRFNEKFDKQLPEKYEEAIKKARFLIKLAIPRAFKEAKHQQLMEKVKSGVAGVLNKNLELFKNRSTGINISQKPQASLNRALTVPRRGSVSSNSSHKGMRKIQNRTQRRGTLLITEGTINEHDTELDWKDRLKQWKKRQQTTGAVTNFDEQLNQHSNSAIFSVLGCLQASFTSKALENRVEQSLVNGLRRSAGLHLINFAMKLTYNPIRFADMIQWLQGALRNNLMQTTHYLTGLEGCGIKAETGIQQQFFQILDRVVHVLKYENLKSATEYVHLLNALCWNYTREDHIHLAKLGLFRALQIGDGTLMHPFQRSWGQEQTNFQLERDRVSEFCLASRLRQVFEFLVQIVLEGLFCKHEEENLEEGGDDAQDIMKTKSQTYNRESSEELLTQICDILFENTHRYLRMKSLFPTDFVLNEKKERFAAREDENDSSFNIKNRCPRDVAKYINSNGGYRIFMANRKLEIHMNEIKSQMFIEKIINAGNIQVESELAKIITGIAVKSLTSAEGSVAIASQCIISRDYRTQTAIKLSSWENLSLEQPVLTMEQKSEVTGISVEEYKAIAEAAIKAKQEEEEAKRKAEAGEDEGVAEEGAQNEEQKAAQEQVVEASRAKEAEKAKPPPPSFPQSWNCQACTYRNTASNSLCEMCQTPKANQASASDAADSSTAQQDWACIACTFTNPSNNTVCAICTTPKVAEQQPQPEQPAAQQEEEKKEEQQPPAQEQSAFQDAAENQDQPANASQTDQSAPQTEANADQPAAADAEQPAAANEEQKASEAAPAENLSNNGEEAKQEEQKEEEEVKEPEMTVEQRQAEEEKQIQAEADPKVRFNKYLNFLLTIQPLQGDAAAEDENKIEGHMYTDTSLFRIIRTLDQMITLSEVSSEGYQIVQRFSNPQNLKNIIELSVETSPQNQILVQRILQQILTLDLPQEILDESVKLAQQSESIKDKPNQVKKLLMKKSVLDLEKSLFLKFIFARLAKSRKALYKSGISEDHGINSVISESIRTIRTLFTEPEKNVSLRKIVNEAFTSALMAIQDLSEEEIDSIMSLIPEAAFKRMAIGTPCVNKEGKVFSVVGVMSTNQENNMYHDIPLYPNYSPEAQHLSLAGLYYDPENPQRQDLLKEKMIYSQPLLDLDEQQTILAAQASVFMDATALEQLIEIALQDDSICTDEQAKNSLSLLQTFIVRGLFNMTRILKSEYIQFLQQFDLLTEFFKLLLNTATDLSAAPEEHLVSSLLLELKADYIREAIMTSDKKSVGIGKQADGGGSLFSSDDGQQIYVMRKGSELPEDMYHFKAKMQFGPEEGKFFEGSICEASANPQSNQNGIFLLPSSKLQEPNKNTMQVIKAAKIIITDSGCNFDDFMKTMKGRIRQDIEQFKQCGQTRFFVLESADDIEKISSIIKHGSEVKNTELSDRGYFLGMILKHIDASIWEKVDKQLYKKKFASIGLEHNYEDVSTVWSTQILAEMIEAQFSQDDSFMVQIQMGETFEMIRSGALIGAAEEQKVDPEENSKQLKKQMSDMLVKDIEEQVKIPSFTELLTQTEKLASDVAENFYESVAPKKPDSSNYLENFQQTIFTEKITPADVAKNYQLTLKTLKQSYSREILLNILSNAQDSLDDQSKELISQKSSFAKLCDLIHNDYMVSSQVNEFHGNPQILEASKENIHSLLTYMKDVPQFKEYFITDLFARAQMTLKKAADQDFEKIEQFTLKNLRKVMEGAPLLDPLNLLFLREEIFELGYASEERLPEVMKAFFDLTIGYALIFKRQPDYFICLDQLRAAKKTLLLINENLAKFIEKENLLTEIFSGRLIQCLAIKMDCESSEELKDRQKLVLELIVMLVKIQDRLRAEFDKDIILGFELSQSIKNALKIFKTIEEGNSFKTFIQNQRFQDIIRSPIDAMKIKHIARMYSTDEKKFECKFKKEVCAPEDQALCIKIDGHTSNDLIEIKKEGQTLLADSGSLKSGKNMSITVPAGTKATIEFPVRPQIVNFSGWIGGSRFGGMEEINYESFTPLQDTAQCAAVKVVAMHSCVMFVGGDDSIWNLGYRCNGQGNEKAQLQRVQAPEGMRNFKKVAHGKFFQLVLTEEGKLFWHGQSRKYMFGMGGSGTSRHDSFHEIENTYFRYEEGDKMIDVCGGKNFTIIATERGKIFATSYMFWRQFQECRYNQENNEDYPFELKLPEGFKAKNIWGSEKYYNMWANGADTDGVIKTFGAGQHTDITGHNASERTSSFKPLAVPDGTYMTKITCHGSVAHGVDNHHNLWVWGSEIYGCNESDDMIALYSGERTNNSKPMLMKWFKEQAMKVLDVESSDCNAIVKVQDKEGKIVFYGLSRNEESLKTIGGAASLKSEYKYLINRLEVDGSRVEDFAMGKRAAYILMAADKQETQSIDPDHPDDKGLIHFYQQPDSKDWKFVTSDQYEQQKDSLPDVCFATRQPMQAFLERVKRIRANKATPEDLADDSLPQIDQIIDELDFDAAVTEHQTKSTNKDESIPAANPLYYSFSKISGAELKIYATETEALSGDQPWDMNPVIYYRVKKPAKALEKLPLIDLTKNFKQSEESESVNVIIMNEKFTKADDDLIANLEISDQATIDRQKAVMEFTSQQDAELLKSIDMQLQALKKNIEQCEVVMFPFAKSSLKPESPLQPVEEKAILQRYAMLFSFSKSFSQAVKYISPEEKNEEGSFSYKHFLSKHLVVSTVINQIVDKQLSSIPNGDTCSVKCNRRKAFEFQDQGNIDHEGKYSIYGQIINQLREQASNMACFRKSSVDDKCYSIKFLGEGSVDAGGPFRDSLVNIVQEMEDGMVPLLIKSPNNRNDHGQNRDCFILNPTSTSPAHLEMYKWLGGFIAYGILSKAPVPLSMAPTVWKQILGEKMTLSDLESIDAYSSQVLTDLQNHGTTLSDADFAAGIDQNFTTVLSNGDEIELCENGQERKVTKESIEEFIGLVLKARFDEGTQQIKAIQEGLDQVFMGKLGLIAYLTPQAIEARACGAKEIDIDRLKSITRYVSCDSNHELVQRFWRVFESWTHEERGLYLKFVWGRNRLPVDLSRLSRQHEVRLYTNMSETGFPQAHTCFFQLDIPFYRTDEICSQRLMQAAQLCGSVDTDNNNFAEE